MIKEMKIWENEIPLYDENIPFENRMTAYLHEDGEVHPAMIVYPGGGYCIHGEWECDPVAQFYYDNGYNAFIVYYRVRPYPHPAPMLDAQMAVKSVRAHAEEWHVDPGRVFGVGFSAGGHLCGCVAVFEDVVARYLPDAPACDSRLTGAILGYPVICADADAGHQDSFRHILGEDAPQELLDTLSLEKHVDEKTAPIFMWHTIPDTLVPFEHSIRLTRAMAAAGRYVECHLFPEGEHGNAMAGWLPGACQWGNLSLDFMKRIK